MNISGSYLNLFLNSGTAQNNPALSNLQNVLLFSNLNTSSFGTTAQSSNNSLESIFSLFINCLSNSGIKSSVVSTSSSSSTSSVNTTANATETTCCTTKPLWQEKIDKYNQMAESCNYDYNIVYPSGMPPRDAIINDVLSGVTDKAERKKAIEAVEVYAQKVVSNITNSPSQIQAELTKERTDIYLEQVNLGKNEQEANQIATQKFMELHPTANEFAPELVSINRTKANNAELYEQVLNKK